MSIKLINHRRRLLHKRFYKAPHKRHKNDNLVLTKAEKIKMNKEKKLAAKNRANKKNTKKKPKRDGFKLPYKFKYYQFQDYGSGKSSLNNLVRKDEE